MDAGRGRDLSHNSYEMGGQDRNTAYKALDGHSSGQAQMKHDEHINQLNQGQDTNILQQTGEGVMHMAQEAANMAKGAAVGAATAVKNTLGMNTTTDNMSSGNTTTTTTNSTNHPSNPSTRI